MTLQDIKDGKVTVTDQTAIVHNGQVYRGKKAIKELVARVVGKAETTTNEVKSEDTTTNTSDTGSKAKK